MLQRLASTAVVLGTVVMASIPAVGLAQGHRYGGSHGNFSRESGSSRGQSFGGGGRTYAPRSYSGGYSRGSGYYGRGYVAPRSYARPVYRPYYRGGVYLNFGVPYGYAYDPGYVYAPGYAYDQSYSYAPAPAQPACTQGTYDQNGAWIPSPDCYSSQQYPQTQQNYGPNQQYPQQQNYDPNQQQYPQTQQQYDDPNQQQYPQAQPNYYPNQPRR
jgi:hypothetical protein